MFCVRCGKKISDESKYCEYCGHKIEYLTTSQESGSHSEIKDITEKRSVILSNSANQTSNTKHNLKVLLWSMVGVFSLIIMSMNYVSISVRLTYTTSDSSYSGFGLLKCIDGTLGIAARMMIVLIVTNIIIVITGIALTTKSKLKIYASRSIIVESIILTIASLIALLNIFIELNEFNPSLTNATVGAGAYINLILSISTLIFSIYINKKHLI